MAEQIHEVDVFFCRTIQRMKEIGRTISRKDNNYIGQVPVKSNVCQMRNIIVIFDQMVLLKTICSYYNQSTYENEPPVALLVGWWYLQLIRTFDSLLFHKCGLSFQ
ncbi:uncharacterized protein [Triticum aestivum]|uniref:uncharacterized protein n=1 Tax=Triticum aestivum TaxID=4565 RepID=UPI00098B2CF4|nr:uncharacterized protein LOC123098561 [Triticum aestivum]